MLKICCSLFLLCVAGHLFAQPPAISDQQDFSALKNGAATNNTTRPDDTQQPLIWRVRDRVLKAGTTVNMDFLAFNFTDIAAYQFALKFDPTQLRFEQIEVLDPGFPLDPDGNFGMFNIAGGELRTLWSTAMGITLPPATPVFRVVLTALAGGKKLSAVMDIDPAIISSVAYNTALLPRGVQLYYADYTKPADPRTTSGETTALQLHQNYPNPFIGCTQIGFTLPEAGLVKLRVLDMAGREYMRLEKNAAAGYQEEHICLENAGAGVFFFELATPYGTLRRRILQSD